MGYPFSGELTNWPCCNDQKGTDPTNTGVQYVISVNGLQGLITLAAGGGVAISSTGNSILIAADGSAGLGTVTTVNATSSNSNLVVTGGPVTTVGTFAFSLAGNLNSISGLTMAADQMLYSTGPGVFAATPISIYSRVLLSDTNQAQWQAGLGISIGGTVQAWSADLDSFVSAASWPAGVLTLTSGITLSGLGGLTLVSGNITGIGADFTDNVTIGDSLVVTNTVTANAFGGDGSSLTGLNGDAITSGTVGVSVGGTNIASYAIGDLLQATASNILTKLASVSAGSYLRSAGVTTASVWSTLKLPNASTVGDILFCASSNTITSLADVATGNVLLSGGVGVVPAYGKVTTSHTTGIAASGSNGDISALTALGDVTTTVAFHQDISLDGAFTDASSNPGNNGDILTSTNTGTAWSSQIALSTLTINTSLSMEATITAGGVTGNQTINKALGSVNIAAGGSSITVTNSLVDANSCVFCQIATNDTTAIIKNVVASSGQFVIRTTAAVTAETRINFQVLLPS